MLLNDGLLMIALIIIRNGIYIVVHKSLPLEEVLPPLLLLYLLLALVQIQLLLIILLVLNLKQVPILELLQ
jgi:hypothetical protein